MMILYKRIKNLEIKIKNDWIGYANKFKKVE